MRNKPKNVLPPVLPKTSGNFTCYAGEIEDEWFGLRFLGEKELKDVTENEKIFLENSLQHTQKISEKFFEETKIKIASHPEIEYPIRIPGTQKRLFSKIDANQQYPIYYLSGDNCDPQRILNNNLTDCTEVLNINTLFETRGKEGYDVGEIDIYGNILAYTECLDGGENYRIIIKNLVTGDERIGYNGYSSDLSIIGDKIVAIQLDEIMRPYKIISLQIDSLEEETLYVEEDTTRWLSFDSTIDEDWLTISSSSHDSTNTYLYKIKNSSDDTTLFLPHYKTPQTNGTHYGVDAHGNHIIVVVDNQDGTSLITDIHNNALIPARGNHHIVDAEIIVFSKDEFPTIVCTIRSEGQMWVECWREGSCTRIRDPKNLNMSVTYLDHVNDSFIVVADSWTQPEILYSVNCENFNVTFLHEWITPGYDVTSYDWRVEQITARDGTCVPVSLVWNKKFSGQDLPALVYVYGAYGSSLDAWWSASRVSLLDRGIMFIVIHARGGGENGRLWHEAGRKENKINTMHDIIDCVSYLQTQKIIGKVILRGGSAGGGAVAATANLSPNNIFHGFIAEVPFVDVLATMSDPNLPLTVGEYEEWGNPQEESGYRNIITWDPIRNINKEKYAKFLVVCGINDPRVGFWESLKFVAKLREQNSNNNVLLRIDEGSGHFGSSGRLNAIREEAEILSFVYDSLIGNGK